MLSSTLTPLLIPSLIIALAMIPLAYQDWVNRKQKAQLSVGWIIPFVLVAYLTVAFFGPSPYSVPLVTVAGVSIMIACVFFFSNNMSWADLLVVIITVLASSAIGSFAFLLVMFVMAMFMLMSTKNHKMRFVEKYPFMTTYFIALIAVLGIAWAFTLLGL